MDRPTLSSELLREKSTFERQQDALNEMAHIVEDCRNRLTVNSNLAERYVEGRLEIGIKFRTRCGGHEFEARIPGRSGIAKQYVTWTRVVERERFSGFDQVFGLERLFHDQVLPGLGADNQWETAPKTNARCHDGSWHVDRNKAEPVLIAAIKLQQRPQEIVSVLLVRLRRRDQIQCINGHSELFLSLKRGFEFGFVSPAREGDAILVDFGDVNGNCAQNLIQWRTQIVQNFAHHDRDGIGDFLGQLESPNLLGTVLIEIGSNSVRASLKEGLDLPIEITDLGYGPFGLGVNPAKRFSFHDIDAFMAKQSDEDEARLAKLTKNLLALPRKPRDESKLGKRKRKPRQEANQGK